MKPVTAVTRPPPPRVTRAPIPPSLGGQQRGLDALFFSPNTAVAMTARLRRTALLPLTAIATLAGCDVRPAGERAARTDSLAVLTQRLAAAERGVRDRDAVVGELAATARLVNAIDSSLSAVQGVRVGRRGRNASDDPWVTRHRTLTAKMASVTELLAASRARVRALAAANGARDARITAYEAAVAELEATVTRQKGELAALAVTVDSLRRAERVVVAARDAARDTLRGVRDTLTGARDAANRVYYVVGRKRDLIARHVVAEEGSRRFLVAGRRTLVPARALDARVFAPADQRADVVITLPDPRRGYRVVSRHDAGLLVAGRRPDGAPDGTLRVTDRERFWSASRYLIIVQN